MAFQRGESGSLPELKLVVENNRYSYSTPSRCSPAAFQPADLSHLTLGGNSPFALSVPPRPLAAYRETSQFRCKKLLKVALRFSGVNFVSLNFIDYVSMALCMGDNRVGDTSDLLDLPQEVGLGRRGSF